MMFESKHWALSSSRAERPVPTSPFFGANQNATALGSNSELASRTCDYDLQEGPKPINQGWRTWNIMQMLSTTVPVCIHIHAGVELRTVFRCCCAPPLRPFLSRSCRCLDGCLLPPLQHGKGNPPCLGLRRPISLGGFAKGRIRIGHSSLSSSNRMRVIRWFGLRE